MLGVKTNHVPHQYSFWLEVVIGGNATRKAAGLVDFIADHGLGAITVDETYKGERTRRNQVWSSANMVHYQPYSPPNRGRRSFFRWWSHVYRFQRHSWSHLTSLTALVHQLMNVQIGHQVVVVVNIYQPLTACKRIFMNEFADLLSSLSLQAGDRLAPWRFQLTWQKSWNGWWRLLGTTGSARCEATRWSVDSSFNFEHPREHPRLGHRSRDFSPDSNDIGGRLASPVWPSPLWSKPWTIEDATADSSGSEHQSCRQTCVSMVSLCVLTYHWSCGHYRLVCRPNWEGDYWSTWFFTGFALFRHAEVQHWVKNGLISFSTRLYRCNQEYIELGTEILYRKL